MKQRRILGKVSTKIFFFHKYNRSHRKRKDNLEPRAVLLIFSLELETSGVAVQSIHQNSKKWSLLGEIT